MGGWVEEKTEGGSGARGGGLTDLGVATSRFALNRVPYPYPVTLIPLRNRSKDHFPPGA